jgi:2-keto-4-pentenoate hydratase
MTTSASTIDELVAAATERLRQAVRTATPCAPVRDLIGADDGDAAYAVQRALAADRIAAGARVIGHKIGLTSPAVQAQLGVDRPDFGLLFDDMEVSDGAVDVTRLLQPKIEAEVAFVLSADINDPHPTAESVRSAVAYAAPALEIVDSRVKAWDITFGDTVADNASAGLFVLGPARVPLADFEPRAATMTMTMNGDPVSAGNGAACLGDPLNALAWLAGTAVAVGDPLRRGHVVLSGALGPMVAVGPGAVVRAEISGLGAVDARFSRGDGS